MAKRGYKLQEFVAHSANVNCLTIGKKACRLFVTGGDDHKVNVWSIGKPTSLMSLCGHAAPVESVAFDSAEVLVLGGASIGAIKLWDLEGGKMVRTLTGHRSNCTAVEFHPFGEFFASGSMDTNLKIWDIRKKGCIHTFKGHAQGISTIRFTPDGRWVVSGGFDNVVKVWDLTAGKLLHDFKFHEGHIRSIDFHPLEFLLATGSADRTVKFLDLESFELIGSSRPEVSGVRAITFHPDGRTLFCGFDDTLKVYSWEPVICHDTVDIGWSALGDLCFNDGKLLGCSLYQNIVAVWVADLSYTEPYGAGVPEQSVCTEKNFNPQGSLSLEKVGIGVRSTSDFRSRSPDCEVKEIKTIYVDSAGGNPIASQKIESSNSPKVMLPLDCKEISDLQSEKQSPAIGVLEKSNGQSLNKSFFDPSIVPQESPAGKDFSISGRESISFSRTKPGMLLRPAPVRRPSSTKYDAERLSTAVEIGSFNNMKSELNGAAYPNSQPKLISSDGAIKTSEEKNPQIKSVTEKILSPSFVRRPSNSKFDAERLSMAVESGIFNNMNSELDIARDPNSQTKLISSDGTVKISEEKDPQVKSFTEKMLRPSHVRRPSKSKFDAERLSMAVGSGSFNNMKSELNGAVYPNSQPKLVSSDGAIKPSEEKNPQIKSVSEKILSPSHVRRPSNSKFDAERLSMAVESGIFNNMNSELDCARDPNSQTKLISSDRTVKISEENDPLVKSVTEKVLRPSHARRPSKSKFDAERLSMAVESGSFNNMKSELDSAMDPNSQTQLIPSDGAVKPSEENDSHIKSVTEKIGKILSPQRSPNQENCDESLNCSKGINPVKFVNGVVPGRTRTLVERFERREKCNSNEDQAANITPQTGLSSNEEQATNVSPHTRLNSNEDQATSTTPHTRLNHSESQNITPHMRLNSSEDQATSMPPCTRLSCCDKQATNTPPCTRQSSSIDQAANTPPCTRLSSSKDQATNTHPCSRPNSSEGLATYASPCMRLSNSEDQAMNAPPFSRLNSSEGVATNTPCRMKFSRNGDQTTNNPPDMRLISNADQATTTVNRVRFKKNSDQATTTTTRVRFKNNADQATITTARVRFRNNPRQATTTATHVQHKNNEEQATINTPHVIVETDEQPTILKEEPQISGRDTMSTNDREVIENLMQTHDVFISTLRSRLTKLQVVQHFWERKDIKGAISALRKLLDHSVQADMISVLMEKMEILNLDLFSCLLPVLTGLLDSKIERHASISLEMLLKLVAVFGPVISSTVSAPPAVGVDLHAEQRQECCNQCFVQLQKIQKILPVLVRSGGSLAKGALELNLVLQESEAILHL